MRRQRRIRVERVDTLNLGSDHRAVIYRVSIGGRLWTLITYNMGGRARGADLVQLITVAHTMTPGCWTLCLQETGDQRETLVGVVDGINGKRTELQVERVQHGGRRPQLRGVGKLAAIVPLGTLMTEGLVELTPRSWVGLPGAGLSAWLPPKYVLRIRQRVDGTVIRVGIVHFVASPLVAAVRTRLHGRQLRRAKRWLKRQPETPSALIGDYNATPSSKLLAPITDDPELSIIGTGSHGGPDKDRRSIDLLTHN